MNSPYPQQAEVWPTALHIDYAPGDWVTQALCAQVDPEIFFPPKGASPERAKACCRMCPVQTACRRFAVNVPMSLDGIWGGLTERERRTIRRQRGIRTNNRILEDWCGTEAGARRHYRAGQPICSACRDAVKRAKTERGQR